MKHYSNPCSHGTGRPALADSCVWIRVLPLISSCPPIRITYSCAALCTILSCRHLVKYAGIYLFVGQCRSGGVTGWCSACNCTVELLLSKLPNPQQDFFVSGGRSFNKSPGTVVSVTPPIEATASWQKEVLLSSWGLELLCKHRLCWRYVRKAVLDKWKRESDFFFFLTFLTLLHFWLHNF